VYRAAAEANRTGTPIVRPLYLAYPNEQDAYATAGAEYLFGPNLLVAPVTTPGMTATTTVWFPPGSTWTDYFTGRRYAGGTTGQITTTLDTMPVFVRSGGRPPPMRRSQQGMMPYTGYQPTPVSCWA
jgi:alpha-glucosidase (family GH31 glycosyl hydrolase)